MLRNNPIIMVLEYTKYECENCNMMFYDRKSAEEHEHLCMDEERKLRDARKLIGRCFRQCGEYGIITLYRIVDVYLDYRRNGDYRKKVLADALEVQIWPGVGGTDRVNIFEEEFIPEWASSLEEIDELVFLSESAHHISEMLNADLSIKHSGVD